MRSTPRCASMFAVRCRAVRAAVMRLRVQLRHRAKENSMTDHDGVAHLGDIDTALRREVEIIAERYPDADRSEVERLVHDTYETLLRDAKVETHVLALTRSQVIDELRERGHRLHVPEAPEA